MLSTLIDDEKTLQQAYSETKRILELLGIVCGALNF